MPSSAVKSCPICHSKWDDSASFCPEDGNVLRSASDPLVGRIVASRYCILQRLGSGGMSTVYLARHALIDRLIAIKFLRPELALDPVQRDRFLREAKAVNRINHPNIVEITDYGEADDGLVFLVMEYVPGETLARLMSDGPLPVVRAIHICEDIASALGRAHQMGVIHRDLKPENILLVGQHGGRDKVKILDFGVAKLVDAPCITGTDQVFGTPGYIAPEMIAGEPLDGRSDLYALGVILYEMLCAALPFDWEYPGDLLVKRLTEEPIPPSAREPGFPRCLEPLVLKLLSRAPSARHRDAFHLLSELRTAGKELSLSDLVPAPPEASERQTIDAPLLPEPDGIWDDMRDTPVSLPPLENLVPLPTVGSRDGIHAAAWWRFRLGGLLVILEEFPVQGGVPAHVTSAIARIESGIEQLSSFERQAQAVFARIDQLEATGRQFRQALGQAIDTVALGLSSRRGELEGLATTREGLRAKRDMLEAAKRRGASTSKPAIETAVAEFSAIEQQLERTGAQCDDLEYQLAELGAQLGRRNEKLERLLSACQAEIGGLARAADSVAETLTNPFSSILEHASRVEGAAPRLTELQRMSGN